MYNAHLNITLKPYNIYKFRVRNIPQRIPQVSVLNIANYCKLLWYNDMQLATAAYTRLLSVYYVGMISDYILEGCIQYVISPSLYFSCYVINNPAHLVVSITLSRVSA